MRPASWRFKSAQRKYGSDEGQASTRVGGQNGMRALDTLAPPYSARRQLTARSGPRVLVRHGQQRLREPSPIELRRTARSLNRGPQRDNV